MAGNPLSISVVINAPVEQVWSLLVERSQANEQQGRKQKNVQCDPAGPPVAGQVINSKIGPLRFSAFIDRVVPADPPCVGQAIFARVRFFGKEGESIARQFCDSESHHIQDQVEIKHPWCTFSQENHTRCLPIDTTSCVVIYTEQSTMALRLIPRWLMRLQVKDESMQQITTRAVEASLQKIKLKAEQNFNQASKEIHIRDSAV